MSDCFDGGNKIALKKNYDITTTKYLDFFLNSLLWLKTPVYRMSEDIIGDDYQLSDEEEEPITAQKVLCNWVFFFSFLYQNKLNVFQ